MHTIAFTIAEPARPLTRGAQPARTWLCVVSFSSALDALRFYLLVTYIAQSLAR
jgi:hypothetical protein